MTNLNTMHKVGQITNLDKRDLVGEMTNLSTMHKVGQITNLDKRVEVG